MTLQTVNNCFQHPQAARRGSVYLMVLYLAAIVTLIGLSGIVVSRINLRRVQATSQIGDARRLATTAVELALVTMDTVPTWKALYADKDVPPAVSYAGGTIKWRITDAGFGNYRITGTGTKGSAVQMMQLLRATPATPIDALKFPLHIGGELNLSGGKSLTVGTSTVSTNGSLNNGGVISGSVEAASASKVGTVLGTVTLGIAAKPAPDPSIPETYASLGTLINPGSKIDKRVLSPGVNPWGTSNPDGVYVVRTTSDFDVTDSRINGTLVVFCPGKKLTIGNRVFMNAARSDYPVLIVHGDLVIDYTSTGLLNETTLLTNFNPPGAPYLGVSNLTTLDNYPSEIRGLIHATGAIKFSKDSVIRGAVIGESKASSNAVEVTDYPQIIYDPSLYSSPPYGYTKTIAPSVVAGSWTRVIN